MWTLQRPTMAVEQINTSPDKLAIYIIQYSQPHRIAPLTSTSLQCSPTCVG